jgi:hypothetical protein
MGVGWWGALSGLGEGLSTVGDSMAEEESFNRKSEFAAKLAQQNLQFEADMKERTEREKPDLARSEFYMTPEGVYMERRFNSYDGGRLDDVVSSKDSYERYMNKVKTGELTVKGLDNSTRVTGVQAAVAESTRGAQIEAANLAPESIRSEIGLRDAQAQSGRASANLTNSKAQAARTGGSGAADNDSFPSTGAEQLYRASKDTYDKLSTMYGASKNEITTILSNILDEHINADALAIESGGQRGRQPSNTELANKVEQVLAEKYPRQDKSSNGGLSGITMPMKKGN